MIHSLSWHHVLKILTLTFALPAALVALGMLMYPLVDYQFVSHREFDPLSRNRERQIDSLTHWNRKLEQDIQRIDSRTALTNCLLLADMNSTSYSKCISDFDSRENILPPAGR